MEVIKVDRQREEDTCVCVGGGCVVIRTVWQPLMLTRFTLLLLYLFTAESIHLKAFGLPFSPLRFIAHSFAAIFQLIQNGLFRSALNVSPPLFPPSAQAGQ